eukprot:TRINITY_DN9022_c0_g1_i3.p1 TRINITY_DN9022_c0_g1~~TRINITY_DN9022_c0_g1_i3.p1  ORF type:complete len:278 (-),score=28.02 TRINITY_DN9022_c0_g1_i3:12-845(-)
MTYAQNLVHIKAKTDIRPLTDAEHKEVKRQRRLVKNREYAQTSRTKKKQFVEDLKQENDLLKVQLKQLSQENDQLKAKLKSLEDERSSPRLEVTEPEPSPSSSSLSTPSPFKGTDTIPSIISHWVSSSCYEFLDDSEFGLPFDNFDTSEKVGLPSVSPYGTVCFLVLLFSFGLFSFPGLFSFHNELEPFGGYSSETNFRTGRSLLFTIERRTSHPVDTVSLDQADFSLGSATYEPLTIEDVIQDEILSPFNRQYCVFSPTLNHTFHFNFSVASRTLR